MSLLAPSKLVVMVSLAFQLETVSQNSRAGLLYPTKKNSLLTAETLKFTVKH